VTTEGVAHLPTGEGAKENQTHQSIDEDASSQDLGIMGAVNIIIKIVITGLDLH